MFRVSYPIFARWDQIHTAKRIGNWVPQEEGAIVKAPWKKVAPLYE